jgi:Uma2 family endonuclease
MDGKDAMPPTYSPDARLTYNDFVLLPDDGLRHEIIDGVHYVTPSPTRRHQRISRRLCFALDSYLREHPSAGEVFYAPFDVVISNWDVVEPDLLVIAGDQEAILTESNVQGAPALVIEILSPGTRTRDEQIKRRLFERSGVREYWLVDPLRNRITVNRRAADGSFPNVDELTAADRAALTTPLLPGFVLDLAPLFV